MTKVVYIIIVLIGFSAYSQTDYRFRNYTINDGLSQSAVTTIIQDNLHALWVGTQDGLNRYNGRSFEVYTSDKTKGLESEYILCSLKDREGNLWFGTSKGLTKFNHLTEEFKTYNTKSGLSLHVQDIVEDELGNLWIASAQSGVYKFHPKEKKR